MVRTPLAFRGNLGNRHGRFRSHAATTTDTLDEVAWNPERFTLNAELHEVCGTSWLLI